LGRFAVRRRANCTDAQGGAVEVHGRTKYSRVFLLTAFEPKTEREPDRLARFRCYDLNLGK
jgi:hypothetical protein